MRIMAIGIGGCIGALLRYVIELPIPSPGGFPLGMLVVNGLGCWFLGWIAACPADTARSTWLDLGLTTGFAGGFTTLSTLTSEFTLMLDKHEVVLTLLIALLQLGAGIGLYRLGRLLARQHQRKGEQP